MTFKVFLTGATGYIGGTVLDEVVTKHPEYEVTTLHRSDPPPEFARRYPNISVVKGDYDNDQVLRDAAARADIVIHCGDSDHVPALTSLVNGLATPKSSNTSSSWRRHLIHLSGAGIASDFLSLQSPSPPYPYGTQSPRVWSDINDVEEILSQPDDALHRATEKLVQECFTRYPDHVKTAIVCPSDIYGPGRGVKGTRSIWLPFYVEQCRKMSRAFYVGNGENRRGWVHINDLARLYLSLVEAAAAEHGYGNGRGRIGQEQKANWGPEGYYFTATQEISQLDMAHRVAQYLAEKKVTDSSTAKQISQQDVDKMKFDRFGGAPGLSLFLFASNTRQAPDRAQRFFGWKAEEKDLWSCIEEDLEAAV